MEADWIVAGGLIAGGLAGWAARFGRLCTMSAIEDALIGGDLRGARAWASALAVAVGLTHAGELAGVIDLTRSQYAGPHLHLPGLVLGGVMFGLGMTLVGTCSFGLLVRAGSGDLRAGVSSMIVGIFAIAVTAGFLAPARLATLNIGVIDLSAIGGIRIDGIVRRVSNPEWAKAAVVALVALPAALALMNARFRRRPRMIAGAAAMGAAVALGWFFSSQAVQAMTLPRPESLSFVAPTGRALLQFMMEPFRNIGFGVAAMLGVVLASFATSIWRGEFRWEAFDDATEMRRHLVGGALMGIGGVFAHGCTIGQGLSASSTLAISSPIFLAAVIVGARVGLRYLLEGQSMWRAGRPSGTVQR